MLTQQERLVNLLQRLELIEAAYGREMPHIKRELADLVRLTRENPTITLPAGIPCAVDFQRIASPDVAAVGFHEPVDASAMIPPRELDRVDRGGE